MCSLLRVVSGVLKAQGLKRRGFTFPQLTAVGFQDGAPVGSCLELQITPPLEQAPRDTHLLYEGNQIVLFSFQHAARIVFLRGADLVASRRT